MVNYRILISAITSAIAYQFIGILAVVTLIPLINTKLTTKHFWLWGLIYMGILHSFLIELNTTSSWPIAIGLWLIATIAYSTFYALFGVIITKIKQHIPTYTNILFPITWVLIEWLKTNGTFANPLGNFGYMFAIYAPYIQAYEWFGPIGVSLAIIVVNQIIKHALYTKTIKKPALTLILLFILLIGIPNQQPSSNETIYVSTIQSSHNQNDKMNRNKWNSISENIMQLIYSAPGNIIVLPETILPADIQKMSLYKRIKNYAIKTNKTIIFGSFLTQKNNVYNGAITLSNKPNQYYVKEKLMPFGEYLPLRSLFESWIPKRLQFSDLSFGENNTLLNVNNLSILTQICLEAIYETPKYNNAELIVVMANTAWFNHSSAGRKLKQFAQVHARTFARPIILSTNYGEAAIINQKGALLQTFNDSSEGILSEKIELQNKQTIYQKWPFLALLIYAFISILIKKITNKKYTNS